MVELSMMPTDDNGQMITPGEAAIMAKLDAIQEQLEELIEKVNNLNLYDNEGYSLDS
jgi:hypothetical protein